MYTIPFIIWETDNWQKTYNLNLEHSTNNPYQSSDLIHTISDMARLQYDRFDPTKSIINKEFKIRQRFIGNPYTPKSLNEFEKIK